MMFARPDRCPRLEDLQTDLSQARVPTAELFVMVAAEACTRIIAGSGTVKSARIGRLMTAEAWTETALALLDLELPQWRLRRLVFEDGGWFCSLSRQWKLPDWLDDTVETRHESLPLAILGAIVAARRCGETEKRSSACSVPRCAIELNRDATVCCDNFS
jgi:hypothetical protein